MVFLIIHIFTAGSPKGSKGMQEGVSSHVSIFNNKFCTYLYCHNIMYACIITGY